ncbi:MAG: cell division protein ZipA C-terminal FtsZ-binding domain-containing protein, partial [Gammaproteobacteria bacterium]|nr:cell division protein ZipA C-terminal FtsZ-binding domain-containing protein [Gammaproteobacteria bacterium]
SRQKRKTQVVRQKSEPIFHADVSTQKEQVVISDPDPDKPKPEPKQSANDFVVMRIIAPDKESYAGYELLQTLLAHDFRFGEMDIFHRYDKESGTVLFSLASATLPGTFDINNMGTCNCHGLTLFMRLADHEEPMQIFDSLLDTAKVLADDLGGTIWNEDRRMLDQVVVDAWLTRVRNYENSLYSYDLFEN